MRWKHTLALVVAILTVSGLAIAIVPFKTATIQMPVATDMGKCPSGVQPINCMDDVAETPKWHYMDGGVATMVGGGGGGSGTVTSVICGTGLTGGTITTTGTCTVSTAQGQSMSPTDNTFAYGDATHRLTGLGAEAIVSGSAALSLTSNMADSGGNTGPFTDTTTALTTSRHYFGVKTGGNEQWGFYNASGLRTIEATDGSSAHIVGNGSLTLYEDSALATSVDIETGAVTIVGGRFSLDTTSAAVSAGSFRYNGANLQFSDDGVAWHNIASAGSSSTLAVSYGTGTTAADQTMVIDPSNGGPIIVAGNSSSLGALLKVTTPGPITLLSIDDTNDWTLNSNVPNSAGVTGWTFSTQSSLAFSDAKFAKFKNTSSERIALYANGKIESSWARAISTGQTIGLNLANTTAAGAGAQQYSPLIQLTGQGWKTDSTAASQDVSWGLQTRPVQGAANPTGDLVFWQEINGGGFVEALSIRYGSITAGSTVIQAPTTTYLGFFDSSLNGFKVQGGETYFRAGAADVIKVGSAFISPASDGGTTLGSASLRWLTGFVGAAGSLPTCDATTRGGFRTVFAASLSADTLQVCMKNTSDAYSWQTAFTAL